MSALPLPPAERAAPRAAAGVEAAVVGLMALLLGLQLFVRPLVGLADNGDFARVAGRFGVAGPVQPPGFQQGGFDRYFAYFFSRWTVDGQRHDVLHVRSSEKLLAGAALLAHGAIARQR